MADEDAAAGKLDMYRRRANELRRIAEGVKNLDAKETIQRIAHAYDHMADMLERFPDTFLLASEQDEQPSQKKH
jgi:hypothetical protein